MKMLKKIKYWFEKFDFLKTYNSPFKPIKPKLYIGKVAIGTPYFFPRRWVKNKEKPGYLTPVPKIIGFDFVGLGYKTKWSHDDYRFEWNPVWSFVFFKWQIALVFNPVNTDHYWECWLYYTIQTNKTKPTRERLKEAREGFPCIWVRTSKDGKGEETCYWNYILKKKWL